MDTDSEPPLPVGPLGPGLLCDCETVSELPGTDSEPEDGVTVTDAVRETVSVGGGNVTKLDSAPELIETESEAEPMGTPVDAVDATSVDPGTSVTDPDPRDSDQGGHPDGMLGWPPGPRPGRGMQSVTVLTTAVVVETDAVPVRLEMLMLSEAELLAGGAVSEPVWGTSTEEVESKTIVAVVVDGSP